MAESTTRFFASLSAIDPATGKLTTRVHVTHQRAEHITQRGVVHVQEMIEFVPEALQKPRAIFRGVRDRNDDWLCYVCAPEQRYMGKMQPLRPLDSGDLFLVFANSDKVAYHWRWERPDPKTGLPKDATRFGGKVL